MTAFNPPSTAESRFNVLDRKESVHRHLLIEASAGTGKTFAIENIVSRLLIESSLLIENILIVTFTRAATRDLKDRIRANLERNLDMVKSDSYSQGIPDYLRAAIEKDPKRLQKCLERALFSFDKAQIFTIHGFCWRMLRKYAVEAGISLDFRCSEDNTLPFEKLMRALRDFMRTELTLPAYSPKQLKTVLKIFKENPERLAHDLFQEITRGIDVIPSRSFDELLKDFKEKMAALKKDCGFRSQYILDDFFKCAPVYKGLISREDRAVKSDVVEKAEQFASLFEKEAWFAEDFEVLIEDGLYLVEILHPGQLMANRKAPQGLHYPKFLETVRAYLGDIVDEARSEAAIFSRLVHDGKRFLRNYQEQEEMIGHDDLLKQMRTAIGNPAFANQVRNQYSAVIVDEFQDTDPCQWEIFSSLFGKDWKGFLHLVGDPKQSIYAFRQADIYTYLSAAKTLGPAAHATLDTNFRSQPRLIDALNAIFNAVSGIFALPRSTQSISYRDVRAGKSEECFSGPALQFFVVKSEGKVKDGETEEIFFSGIAKEILRLHEQEGAQFNQMAVLISDRFQADRICCYFKRCSIPVKSQKEKDLSHSQSVDAMRELLQGILHFHSRSALNVALAGRVIKMTDQELLAMEADERLLPILERCNQLKRTLVEQGFSQFYSWLMQSTWHHDGKTVLERLLEEEGGDEFYREWQDLADFMIFHEHKEMLSPQALVELLDNLDVFSRNNEEGLKVYADPDEDSVAVLTTHVSKGLEFDVVFTLGLIKRSRRIALLIPEEDRHCLSAPKGREDSRYLKYCEEVDAEKMRQLYVAFTRAKYRLYVPIVLQPKKVPFGLASPMELFLSRLHRPADYQEIYEKIANEDGKRLIDFAHHHSSLIGFSYLQPESPPKNHRQTEQSSLIPPTEFLLPGEEQVVQSFTSLALPKQMGEDALRPPHDFFASEKTEHFLPAGNETGLLLHTIFEKLSFRSAQGMQDHKEVIPLVYPFVYGTAFAAWEEVISKVVFNALTTPLPEAGFCLADIDPKKMYRENEFLFAAERRDWKAAVKPGFLKGFVDLFFEHRGKFYLLDWKSNWLGPSQEDYQPQFLQEAMRSYQYDLQAEIYTHAMQSYLSLFDKRPFEEVFGGVYYLFLRGIGPKTGIYKQSMQDRLWRQDKA